MNKSKSYGKVLIACIAASYLQLAGSVGLVFAEDLVPEVPSVVEDIAVLPEDPEPEDIAVLPEEPVVVLPTAPDVEIFVADGVLSYKVLVEEKGVEDVAEKENIDESLPLTGEENLPAGDEVFTYRAEWWTSVPSKNGVTQTMVSGENEYTPESSGDYEVRVWSVDVDGNESESYGSDSEVVTFPVFDESQLIDLTYRAGETFSLEYTDDFGFADLTVTSGDEVLTVTPDENVWIIEGTKLTIDGDYDLVLTATSDEGFQSIYNTQYSVSAGVISSAYSTLSVTMNGEEIEYVEAGSGDLDIVFTAYDGYKNEVDVESLDSVQVRLDGEMLEGADYVGDSQYMVERTARVPGEENSRTEIAVDVFSEECDGELAGEPGYCFSKIATLVVYDTDVIPVSDLVYMKRTSEGSITIFGTKVAGYGIKVNSTSSEYVVEPNDLTTFSFEMPLAEGVNEVGIYAVKVVSDELVFYSDAVVATVQKDTTVSAPVWRDVSITLDGDNQATLHWIDPIYLTDIDYDFSHVNIYRSTVPNFVPNADNLVAQTHNPSWTDTGLTAGTAYYYTIESVDDLGNTAMINAVESSGDILGESATVASEQVWYDDLFAGKGEYDEPEETVGDEESVDSVGEEGGEVDNEGFANKMSELFNKAKTGTSDFANKVFDNIFVQIIIGGVVIFLGLMVLISVLVWLKEKVVSSSFSLEEVDTAIKKGKTASSQKSKKTAKKRTTKAKKSSKRRKKK